MTALKQRRFFKTNRRVRLGIWGLGRGMSFYNTCSALGIDVVAGCDYNQHMREHFLKVNPNALVTDSAEEFLKGDFDAVLLATFCPAHADDAIWCLRAGKHVLSEVTSFHTMAEGVRLVDAVEKSGLVYNLAENYPFSAANMYLARTWKEGLFGDLMYAEYEYVHECLALAYTYIDGTPISRGDTVHNWRSWLSFHYYNTHSLGPMMLISGTRPTRVVALPGKQRLAGYLMDARLGMGGITPSLINMSNGAIVRNLMGATTNDSHIQRLWGTKGSAEIGDGRLRLRLGGSGGSPKLEVIPHWDKLGELAASTGHGGGDFWVLYYFIRQILDGQPAPFDVYSASDCTIPGILAYRSQAENGRAYDVPDFRDMARRNSWRNDTYAQPRYDVERGVFPKDADYSLTRRFSVTMRDLIAHSRTYRAYREWAGVMEDMSDPSQVAALADQSIAALPRMQDVQKVARQMIERYPDSDGARVLSEILALTDPGQTSRPSYLRQLKAERAKLSRRAATVLATREKEAQNAGAVDKWHSPFVTAWRLSRLMPKKGDVSTARAVKLSERLGWIDFRADTDPSSANLVNVHSVFDNEDGIAYLGSRFRVRKAGAWAIRLGHDGGCAVFVDGTRVLCVPQRSNPAMPDRSEVVVKLSKGTHEIICAFDTDSGMGWGIYFRFAVPKSKRKGALKPESPASAEQ